MAIVPPVLFFTQSENLNSSEQARLNALKTKAILMPNEIAELNELESRAKNEIELIDMIPIIFDGTIVPASISDYAFSMRKKVENIEGVIVSEPFINTVSINIRMSKTANFHQIYNVLFMLAEKAYNQPNLTANVRFFSDSVVINQGYLMGVGRSGNASTSVEIISLTIAMSVKEKEPTGLGDISIGDTTDSFL